MEAIVTILTYKHETLYNLKRYKEALTAFEQAIHFDPNNADAYEGKGYALIHLDPSFENFDEAQLASIKARQLRRTSQ
jgi:Flp pilus assembly protein TadD